MTIAEKIAEAVLLDIHYGRDQDLKPEDKKWIKSRIPFLAPKIAKHLPDQPEVPWPSGIEPPFDVATDIHNNWWVTAGGDYVLSINRGEQRMANLVCRLLNAANAQKGGD